jgi:predicted metal-dependent enzyme (double-stranded beta helix superfamily)
MHVSETERAAHRASACHALLARIQEIERATQGAPFPSPAVLAELLSFVEQHRGLFPEEDFPSPRAHGRFHPLIEAGDAPYGLYYGVTRPGKEAAPHDHGIWCATVAFSGAEVNRFWDRTDDGTSETSATIAEIRSVTVEPGCGMFMQDHSIHSTLTIGDSESRLLHLYARPFDQFPPVVFYHPNLGTRRRLPANAGRTIRG